VAYGTVPYSTIMNGLLTVVYVGNIANLPTCHSVLARYTSHCFASVCAYVSPPVCLSIRHDSEF